MRFSATYTPSSALYHIRQVGLPSRMSSPSLHISPTLPSPGTTASVSWLLPNFQQGGVGKIGHLSNPSPSGWAHKVSVESVEYIHDNSKCTHTDISVEYNTHWNTKVTNVKTYQDFKVWMFEGECLSLNMIIICKAYTYVHHHSYMDYCAMWSLSRVDCSWTPQTVPNRISYQLPYLIIITHIFWFLICLMI